MMLSALRTRAAAAPVMRSAARSMSIFGAPKGRTQPPMDEPYPGTPSTSPAAHPVPEVHTSTTANGVRVVSVEANQAVSRVTILSATGSKFETDGEKGSANVLKTMGLSASNKRSALRLIYDVETAGGAVSVSSDRDVASHSAVVGRDQATSVFHALAESITDARLREWEVEEAIEATRAEASTLSVDQWAVDAIHAAAFREDSALGSPYALPAWNAGLSASDVLGFRQRTLVPSNVVVVGAGIEHKVLESLAETFGAPSGSAGPVKANYVGGCVRERTASSLAHVGVAFGVAGEQSAQDFAVAQVLSALLGGSPSSYKYKVPGSGTTSALATEVQNKVEGVVRLSGFLAAHPEASLLGAFATVKPAAAGEVTTALAKAFSSVAATPMAADALARAKAVAKGALAHRASSDAGTSAALARSTLVHGSPVPLATQLAAIDAVTAEQVHAAAKAAFGKRPTLVATGAISQVPHFDDFVTMF